MTRRLTDPWRSFGDPTAVALESRFAARHSPLQGHAAELIPVASPHAMIMAAHSEVENRDDTVGILIDHTMHNHMALRPRGYPEERGARNGFAVFDSYADCVRAWRRRLTDDTIDTGKAVRNYVDAETFGEYCAVYNPPGDVHPATGEANNPVAYGGRALVAMDALGEGTDTMVRPSILIFRGHGTAGDTGAPGEEENNRRLTPEVVRQVRAAGYDVTSFPDNVASEGAGTLDTAGRFAHDWMARTPGTKVMLDCHLEWSPSSGMFAIVPNGAGLITGAPFEQPARDTWANNVGDRALAHAIVSEVSARTGMPIRSGNVREPGVMGEEQTNVGQGGGGAFPPSRLAMFAYTAPFVDDAYRLVVEFGSLTHDQSVFGAADWPAKSAAGVVAALNKVFDVDAPPAPTPEPKYATRHAPPLPVKTQIINGALWLRFGRTMVANEEAPALEFALTNAKPVAKPFAKDKRANFAYATFSDGQMWLVSRNGTRTPAKHWRDG